MNTEDLQKLLGEAREIASERREKATESHMMAMFIRNSTTAGASSDGFQTAADYALATARILDQTAELARRVIAAEKLAEALRAAHDFIASEYACAEAQALHGEYLSAEARPTFNAICAAIAEWEATP